MKQIIERLIITILCLCVLGTVGFFAVGNGIYSYALLRKGDVGYTEEQEKRWIVQNSKDVYITSEDGLKLHAHFKRNPRAKGRYAIMCHGGSGNAIAITPWTRELFRMGFNVLCPNARAHGKSEGDAKGMGYPERRDIIQWINQIIKKDPDARILLFGLSVGGATVLLTSGENDLPENVKAVVSDCAFTNLYEEFGNIIRRYVPFLPNFPVVDSVSLVCKIRDGYFFREADCVEAVKRSKTPTLFIHGNADTRIPLSMLDTLYENAGCEKEKLIIDGAGHADARETDPRLYWRTVKNFLKDKFI